MPSQIRRWALAALLVVGAARAETEEPVRAVPLAAGETIALTGRLDHPAWQRAPVFDRFVEKEPRTGAAPSHPTRVRVLFDERAIYVGVEARDPDPARVRDTLVRSDGVNRTQDFVVVYLDPIGTKRSAQFFRVNAGGSTADGLHTAADDNEDFAPDFDWDAAVARDAEGWSAVLRLPFASLRFAEGDQGRWRIMVARRIPRENFHLVTSMLVPREAPSFIDRLQPLTGIRLPEVHDFLTIRPSLTLRRSHERSASGQRSNDHDVDTTLDVKWRPRAEAVLDATINPDFSQVALDVPQLVGNTRFALSLAEKRPFFFESADLLRTPTEAFYTRSFTAPRWGLRGTWRGTELAGSVFGIDDRGRGLVLLPGPYGTGAADQPASRTVATRLRSDQGDVQWGAVVAARRYERGRGENDVAGPDLAWSISDAWRLRAQWLHARTTAQPDAGGRLDAAAAAEGDRLFLKLQRNVEDAETTITLEDLSDRFRHDSGFVPQAGIRKLELFQSLGWRPLGPFNDFWPNLTARHVAERASGRTIEQQLYPGLWTTAARNLEAWVEWHGWAWQRARPDSKPLRQNYLAASLVMTPAGWWPLVDTKLDIGRLADTVADRVRPGLRWTYSAKLRPLAPLELEPSGSVSFLREGGQRVYDESTFQLLAVWHLGSRSHLRAIAQRTRLERREAGADAVRGGDSVASLTWSWRYSAGTVLYLGASRSRGLTPLPRSSEAFVKLQLDVDDWSRM